MPRESVANTAAKAITNRLKELAAHRYGSMEGLLNAYEVSPSTSRAWKRRKSPSVPDIPFLLRLAERDWVDLNWLLLGEGSMARRRNADDSETSTLAVIEAELRAQERPGSFADDVWDQMRSLQTRAGGFNAIVRFAVEGVRPLYRQLLIQSHVSRVAIKWAEDFVYVRESDSPFKSHGNDFVLADFAERLGKQLGPPPEEIELPGGEVLVQKKGIV